MEDSGGGGGVAVESAAVDISKQEVNASNAEEAGQVVTPWEVAGKDGGKIDYDKLIVQFGCQKLDQALIDRVERLTGKPAHPFLRRGVFFAHRSPSAGSRNCLHQIISACVAFPKLPMHLQCRSSALTDVWYCVGSNQGVR